MKFPAKTSSSKRNEMRSTFVHPSAGATRTRRGAVLSAGGDVRRGGGAAGPLPTEGYKRVVG